MLFSVVGAMIQLCMPIRCNHDRILVSVLDMPPSPSSTASDGILVNKCQLMALPSISTCLMLILTCSFSNLVMSCKVTCLPQFEQEWDSRDGRHCIWLAPQPCHLRLLPRQPHEETKAPAPGGTLHLSHS